MQQYKPIHTYSLLLLAYNASYLVHTCRCNCASCCTCHHSTGKGRGPQGQGWPLADDTSQHTSHFHRKAHPCTSFCKDRGPGMLLRDFTCSTLTSSTGNGHLPPVFALWVPPETSATSGSLLTGTGNCFHLTTGRDLGRHRMFAPGHFSKALSRNHYRKFLVLALSGSATCFLLTSALLHSPGSEGLPLRSHKPAVPPESSRGWTARGSRPSCSRDAWNQQNILFGLKKKKRYPCTDYLNYLHNATYYTLKWKNQSKQKDSTKNISPTEPPHKV